MVNTYTPKSLEEALEILSNKPVTIFAGGTDLMVEHLIGSNTVIKFDKPTLHINKIKELKEIKEEVDFISIGAACIFYDIINNPLTPYVLKESASKIAGPPIRNIATIGGNICNASPSADSLPALYTLNTKLKLVSKNSERIIPIKEFIVGVAKTTIKEDEILTSILIPKESYIHSFYRKVGTRQANALSKLAMSALVVKESDNYTFRIAFCTLGVTITRSEELENTFKVKSTLEWKNNIAKIKEEYNKIIKPRDSARSTALYRRKCALNLIEEFIESI